MLVIYYLLFFLVLCNAENIHRIKRKFQFISLTRNDFLDHNNPGTNGWLDGSCELEKKDNTISVPNIKTGRWNLAYFSFLPAYKKKKLSPFILPPGLFCIYFEISHDYKRKEMILNYKCQDMANKTGVPIKCQKYVKFNADQLIKYEISHGCSLNEGIWSVSLAKTDYINYLVIRGCLNGSYGNRTLYGMGQMVLLRNEVDVNTTKEIKSFLKPYSKSQGYFLMDITIGVNIENCDCEKHFCEQPLIGECYPMAFLAHRAPPSLKLYRYLIGLAIFSIFVMDVLMLLQCTSNVYNKTKGKYDFSTSVLLQP